MRLGLFIECFEWMIVIDFVKLLIVSLKILMVWVWCFFVNFVIKI